MAKRAERIVVLVAETRVDLEPLPELQPIEDIRSLVVDLAVRPASGSKFTGPV